jgi:hypothetical protein
VTEPVQWPGKAFNPTGNDLGATTTGLLEALRLLSDPADRLKKPGLKTPASLQVLTSGSTAITKVYTVLATAVGGGGALVAGTAAFWDRALRGSFADQALQRSVLMASAALLGSAVVLAVAIMVRGDVQGRAAGHAAKYAARAEVAAAFLHTVQAAFPQLGSAEYYVQRGTGQWLRVNSFEWDGSDAVAVTAKDRLPASEWRGLVEATACPVSTP